uniref:Uncharacterized protein n=1 Tax=viral metagenome TaxID=1070528 RepID=A0A6H1ZJD2_9ZZZZ
MQPKVIDLAEYKKSKEPVWGKSLLETNMEYLSAQEEIIRLTGGCVDRKMVADIDAIPEAQ